MRWAVASSRAKVVLCVIVDIPSPHTIEIASSREVREENEFAGCGGLVLLALLRDGDEVLAGDVADDAGGGPGSGEGGAGLGATEAQDEAVHLLEELGDFRKAGAEGDGEGGAAGNGGRSGGDLLEVGGCLGEQGGIGGGEVVVGEFRGGLGEGGAEFLMEEAGFGDELGVAEALPGTQGKVDLGGIAFAAVFLIPVGEGLADLVGEGFEFLFLAFLGFGIAGGGGLLAGDEVGESMDERRELGGAGGECGGFLVFSGGFKRDGCRSIATLLSPLLWERRKRGTIRSLFPISQILRGSINHFGQRFPCRLDRHGLALAIKEKADFLIADAFQ